jgi:glycosyltransferase involved in cell wall biosynthesis
LSLGKDLNPEYRIPKVKFYLIKKFPLRPLRPLFYLSSVKKILKKINPDVFHAHYVWIEGIIGALSGFHPFVLTTWGSDVLVLPKSKIMKPLVMFALSKADLITCDAEHMKEAIIRLGVKPEKVKIVYFGVDTKKFSPGPKDKELIKKLGIENCPVVISLRNLKPIYDVETLIKAVPFVLKENPNTKFIIAGIGPEEKKLKNLAKKLKILESVRFVGWISNIELPKYLRISDIYVSTSLSDGGLAASTAEAMSCGLSVVITNFGDNKKWVQDGENGFLFNFRDYKTLAEKIVFLIKNPEIRKNFGEKNRKIIEEKNNYYREMEKMENFYKELATNRER